MHVSSEVFSTAAVAAVFIVGMMFAGTAKAQQISPEQIALPAPAQRAPGSLEDVLARRRSVREFSPQVLKQQEIGQLLWAAQGITHEQIKRTAPSAGALYPLEIYVATAAGLFHYLPQGHRMTRQASRDLRQALYQAAWQQDSVREAPAVFVITAVYERTARKYGGRAERYILIEAGHAAQNLLLQATALGLGGVPVGAFSDADVQQALSLPPKERPLYLLPVGHPR